MIFTICKCQAMVGFFLFFLLVALRSASVALGQSICSWYDGSLDQSFMVDPLNNFLFQPVGFFVVVVFSFFLVFFVFVVVVVVLVLCLFFILVFWGGLLFGLLSYIKNLTLYLIG